MKNINLKKFHFFALSFVLIILLSFNCFISPILADENSTDQPQAEEKPVYCFLGSSVTYGHTTGGISFVDYLARDNGWKCIKRAVSGTTLVDNGPDSYVQRMKKISSKTKIDHFVCQLSTNDATQVKLLGTVSGSKNMEDFKTSTIIGAMEYIIAYARETWNCPVTFYTNPYYNNRHYEKMIDALYKLQEKWDIGIIDFYYYKDMEELPKETLKSYMSDSIHPNSRGYRWMANVMTEYFNKVEKSAEPTPTPEQTQDVSNDDQTPAESSNSLLYIVIFSSVGVVLVVLIIVFVLKRK